MIHLRLQIVAVFNAVNLLQQIAHTVHLKDEHADHWLGKHHITDQNDHYLFHEVTT